METTLDDAPPKTTATLPQTATRSSSTLEVISGGRDAPQGAVCVFACVAVCPNLPFSPGCPLAISTPLSGQAQMSRNVFGLDTLFPRIV